MESLPNQEPDLAETPSTNPKGPSLGSNPPVQTPLRVNFVPFFLSAVFYLSTFFAIFSPLPILYVFLKKGRAWALSAAVVNASIVLVTSGWLRLAFYGVFVLVAALSLGEFLQRKKSLEKAATGTLFLMLCISLAGLGVYAKVTHTHLVVELQSQISSFVELLSQSVSPNSGLVTPAEVEEWKQSLLREFPSAVSVFALILVWANLVVSLKYNFGQIQEKLELDSHYLRKWKAPEYLVWPTILCGFGMLFDFGVASDVALNIFRFLMAIYAIQGLSILSYCFDAWNVKGVFRLLGFSLSLFFMMPFVLSLGFFDLWFDFRAKFRQSL